MSNESGTSASAPATSVSPERPFRQLPLGQSLSAPDGCYGSVSSLSEHQSAANAEVCDAEPSWNSAPASAETRQPMFDPIEPPKAPSESAENKEPARFEGEGEAKEDVEQRFEVVARPGAVRIPEEEEDESGTDDEVDGGGEKGEGGQVSLADEEGALNLHADEQRDRFGDTDDREPADIEPLRERTSRFGSLLRRPQLHHQQPNYRNRRNNNNNLQQKQHTAPVLPLSGSGSRRSRHGPLPPLGSFGPLQHNENAMDYSTYRSGGVLFLRRRHSIMAINRFASLWKVGL